MAAATLNQEELLQHTQALARRAAIYDSIVPGQERQPVSSESQRMLQEQCDQLSEQISQAHSNLKKTSRVDEGPTTELKIQHAQIRHLKAEIHTQENRDIASLPQESDVLHELLKEELTQSVTQLQHTLSAVRSRRRELTESIEREKKYLDEHKQIKGALEQKVVDAVSGRVNVSEGSYKKEVEEKTKKATAYMRTIMKWLLKFVATHYPSPSTEQTQKWRKKNPRSQENDMEYTNFLPLQDILEELMNKAIESAHDPYIEIHSGHWPPYVELLLRCGIALKHPETDSKIKMTPYHY